MGGLRRATGLHLLNYGLNLRFSRQPFFDLLQWFQAAVRRNKMTGGAHYLTGLEGCGYTAHQSM